MILNINGPESIIWAITYKWLNEYLLGSQHRFFTAVKLWCEVRLWYQLKWPWCRARGGWIGAPTNFHSNAADKIVCLPNTELPGFKYGTSGFGLDSRWTRNFRVCQSETSEFTQNRVNTIRLVLKMKVNSNPNCRVCSEKFLEQIHADPTHTKQQYLQDTSV